MLILLDCRPLQKAGPDSEKSRLIFSVAAALSRDPGLRWLLVTDESYPPDSIPQHGGFQCIKQKTLPGILGWRFWYDRQIPRLAKKHGAEMVMLTGGIASRAAGLPQCLWMPERANPGSPTGLPLYARRLLESLRRAGAVFCFSRRDRDWLLSQDKQAADKLVVLHPWPDDSAGPLSVAGRETVKAQLTQGREYFFADVATAGEDGVIRLLKAFSLFKKRQLSNLRLVIAGVADDGLKKILATYKYREEVHWCPPSPDSYGRLAAGAYAVLYLFDGISLGTPLLNAWKAGVPVILTAGGYGHELAGEAALAADGADPASLAAHLMSVYKDETLRSRLIGLGQTRLADFGPEHTINAVRAAMGLSPVVA
jgi:glycosyltransferase involved in cell wall biosynthesis